MRYAGADRYATALQIVEQGLGDPPTIFLTTGTNFPDALTAGAAAAHAVGGILLTDGNQMPPSVAAYLQANAGDTVYAVGGPAAAADPTATAIVGADRYLTSAQVASTIFGPPVVVGLASGTNYPDALAGGATMGEGGGPLLLTDPNTLSPPAAAYLGADVGVLNNSLTYLFGGTQARSDNVRTAISQLVPSVFGALSHFGRRAP